MKQKIESARPGRVLIPVGIGLAFSLLGDATLYTVLPNPDIALQAGVSLGMVGILLGINRLVRIAFNSPAGFLYDHFPRRGLMIASALIGMLSTVIYAVGYGPAIMIVGRALWGMAWSGMWLGCSAIALDISNEKNRGQMNGRLQVWFQAGVGLSALAGGMLTDWLGYRGGLWVSSAFGLITVLAWLFFLPETRCPGKAKESEVLHQSSSNAFPWAVVLKASVPIFAVRVVFAGVLYSTTILWLSQFFKRDANLGTVVIPLATLTGLFMVMRVLSGIVSAPFFGWLSDRLMRRWLVLFIVLGLGAVGVWLMTLQNLALAVIGMLMASFTSGTIPSLVSAITGDYVNNARQGRALSILYTFGDLGSAIGPPVALFLIPVWGIAPVYQVCAGIYLVVAVFALANSLNERQNVPAQASSEVKAL